MNYIVFQNLIILKSNLAVEKVIDYARTHMEKHLSIGEAADIAGKSISSISHLFTKMLQKPFQQVMTDLKVERADVLFSQLPCITVKEVAAMLGYEDEYYFSRIYKKTRGYPPSKSRLHCVLQETAD